MRVFPSVPLTLLLCLACSLIGGWSVYTHLKENLPGTALFAGIATAAGTFAVTAALTLLLHKRAERKARDTALTERYGAAALDEIASLAETYGELLSQRDSAKQEAAAKAAAVQSLWQTVDINAEGILEEVRRFAPAAYDIPSADAALRASALLRKELAEAHTAARDARLRAELQAQQAPPAPDGGPELSPPPRDRATVSQELESVQEALAAARANLERIAGRLQSTGDPLALQAAAEKLTDEIAALEGEYDALQLAMSALEQANSRLQDRFSPALGRRASEIFAGLTGGAYGSVILDRSLRASAEPAGTGVPRDTGFLSAGAADQLYLAVRLAVCELVLPAENAAPIVLDDALACFDDQRCAAALAYLRKEAEGRQILLFTCHSREAEFFREDPGVAIQYLTEAGAGV